MDFETAVLKKNKFLNDIKENKPRFDYSEYHILVCPSSKLYQLKYKNDLMKGLIKKDEDAIPYALDQNFCVMAFKIENPVTLLQKFIH
ncbi:MAG: hypothetical protein ABSD71_15015 [Bacteroidales bacterium]|jgi:hypothetical protein